MSKSIYEQAITATNILCANDFDNSPNNPSLNATEILDNFNIINEALEQAQKQEKLLDLYKELSNYVSEQMFAHELHKITRLKILIKELEND